MSIFGFKITELKIVGLIIVLYGLALGCVTLIFDPAKRFFNYSFGLYSDPDFWVGLIVEAHGFFLDLVILGFVLVWMNKTIERSQTNTRYQDEIDDFRPWRTPEAAFRIAGCVKRLANDGVRQIDLYECFLKNADLRGLNLTGAKLWGADLGGAILKNSVLADAKMKGCYLAAARCSGANFERAYMTNARCKFGQFSGCKFREAVLMRVDFTGVSLRNADLHGSDLTGAIFKDADLTGADLRDAIGLSVAQLLQAKSLRAALVSSSILNELVANHIERIKIHVKSDGSRFVTLR